MASKHRNTFEGGLDQDSSKKYAKQNTFFSASNITISKEGYIGEASTFEGFKEIKDSSGNRVSLNSEQVDLHILDVNSGMMSGTILFSFGDIIAIDEVSTIDIMDNFSLYNQLKDNYNVYLNDSKVYLYLDNVVSINQSITFTTILAEDQFKNLGAKEITLRNNNKLIFLFREGVTDGTLNLQLIVYKDLENKESTHVIGTGFVFSGNIKSSTINSDNIIYNKETEQRHSLYWCDGENPDKVINFTVSLDIADYPDFQTYIDNR